MLTTITVNIATGIIIALFTGWFFWRKREKLILSYTITESDFFPFHNEQGKYYAIKIANNGGKLIKNITVDISISDAEIETVTTHELMNNLNKQANVVKFTVDILNPKEDINFVITSKVKETSKPKIKIRGEGVNALEKSDVPSKSDITGTAIIWAFIGFLSALIFINVMAEETPINDRIDNVFGILNKAGLPHVFHQIIEHHDDLTYEGTAFYLVNAYLKDTANGTKYITALKNISSIPDIALKSKGVAYYLIYKIDVKSKNMIEANKYLEKCKKETPDTYEYLIEQDQNYNLDSIQTHLKNYY